MEKLLEEILLSDEIPGALGVIQSVQEEEMLTETDQELIGELFDALEMVHDQLATACSLLGRLSYTLKPGQLMLVIKASIRPLIQMNAAAGLEIATTTRRTPELPGDQAEQIKLMIVPDPEVSQLKKEKINSPTRLLVATYAFKTLNRFGNGTTQWRMQERYQVRTKQLVACITGRKYLGGTDKKSIAKKRKAQVDEPEPSTSAQ